MSIGTLVGRQNPDGGWPYVRGGSWTEPTVYALMAVLAADERDAARRGIEWLHRTRRPDGGWPPRPGIDQSTWVTALVALLPAENFRPGVHAGAIAWLLGTTGRESTTIYRLRQWLLGVPTPRDQEFTGWPWVPGTAAWVGPTSMAMLALDKENSRNHSSRAAARIAEGRRFLLRRACQGGGWNHGSARALGYDSRPYPETTGMALAALRGVQAPEVKMGITVATRFLQECRSADALNWLQLGLYAQHEMPAGYCVPSEVNFRTVPETSLGILITAIPAGRQIFWG